MLDEPKFLSYFSRMRSMSRGVPSGIKKRSLKQSLRAHWNNTSGDLWGQDNGVGDWKFYSHRTGPQRKALTLGFPTARQLSPSLSLSLSFSLSLPPPGWLRDTTHGHCVKPLKTLPPPPPPLCWGQAQTWFIPTVYPSARWINKVFLRPGLLQRQRYTGAGSILTEEVAGRRGGGDKEEGARMFSRRELRFLEGDRTVGWAFCFIWPVGKRLWMQIYS